MKVGYFGSLAFAVMLPGAVMANSGVSMLGFTGEDVARGYVERDVDRASSASRIHAAGNGSVEVLGFWYRGDSSIMAANRLVAMPSGEIIIEGGTLSGLDDGKGIASFVQAEFSSPSLFERVMTGDSCAPLDVDGSGGQGLGEIEFVDMTLKSPPSATELVHSSVGQNGPESINFEEVKISFEGIDELGCFMMDEFDASGISALSADGTRGTAATISVDAHLLPRSDKPFSIEVSVYDLAAHDPSGLKLIEVDSTNFSLSMDDYIVEGIRKLTQGDVDADIPEIVDMLANGTLDMSYRNAGIYFPLGDLLSETQRVRLGANGDEFISGGHEISVSLGNDQLSILNDTTLHGLVYAYLDLDLIITPDTNGSRAVAMTGGHPAGLILPYLQLDDLLFSVEDNGLWDLIDSGTGSSVEEHLTTFTPMLSKGPSEISEPVISWIMGVARDGHGGVTMTPLEPVGFMEIMMGVMMNPGGVGRMLSIEAR
ncbi:hypothetical protein KUV57_12960 [Epibacterium sp. DP7N7-1]|nr:hypothetical protein [Epibacterium sp. DP7N7-1]